MHAYIINLDHAKDRWEHVSSAFSITGISFERIPAIYGSQLVLPMMEFDEARYRRKHGKRPNLGQVGCYLSHVLALRTFLRSEHEHAVICEDDSTPQPALKKLLEKAIEQQEHWDLLRLCGVHNAHPRPFRDLIDGYSLAINMTRLCGTGAYMVNRNGAEILVQRLLPMWLPIDHALDREWAFGIKVASIDPLPVDQVSHSFGSQLVAANREKLPIWQRYWTVFPYRAGNEARRVTHRLLCWRAERRNALKSAA